MRECLLAGQEVLHGAAVGLVKAVEALDQLAVLVDDHGGRRGDLHRILGAGVGLDIDLVGGHLVGVCGGGPGGDVSTDAPREK